MSLLLDKRISLNIGKIVDVKKKDIFILQGNKIW